MKLDHSPHVFRLHHSKRRELWDIALATSAVVAAGVFTGATGNSILDDGGPATSAASTVSSHDDCEDRLWERLHVSGQAEANVESAAAEPGLVTRGPWISFDGLSWEHLDGRIVVVAHPRSATTSHDTDCTSGAVTDGTSQA